jgi:hypothetical protein
MTLRGGPNSPLDHNLIIFIHVQEPKNEPYLTLPSYLQTYLYSLQAQIPKLVVSSMWSPRDKRIRESVYS